LDQVTEGQVVLEISRLAVARSVEEVVASVVSEVALSEVEELEEAGNFSENGQEKTDNSYIFHFFLLQYYNCTGNQSGKADTCFCRRYYGA
jgi:hypothetical protein